jgi:adenine-specific DNA-methyltransferase
MKRKAMKSMSELIKNIDSTHVIVSYNNEGIIHEEDLISLMKSNAVDGNVYVEKIPYRKYKSKKPSKTNHVYELLLYIRKKKRNNVMVNLQNPPLKTQKWSAKKEQLIKSPMNYIGGKYRLLRQILPLFPQDIDVFVDLFSGGANVGINVKANKHIFNDMNDKVNEIFRYFAKNNPDDIIHKIKDRITEFNLSKYNEQSFKEFRDKYNQDPNPLDLYVLTSYSYNHQVRFNNSMEFNNPFGRNRSQFSENMEKNLMRFVRKLHTLDATFLDNYFDELDLSWLSTSDFVYLDPPYLITTGNYNDGNRGFKDWGEQQERRLYELMDLLSNNCVRYALSNVLEHKGKSNEMLKNYLMKRNVNLHDVEYNYDNASHNSKSTGSREVLITNYDAKTGILLN